MKKIDIDDFVSQPVDLWLNQWFVLMAGVKEHYNCMTVAWGSIGGMWEKPFVQVVVRPSRYTYEFMEKYNTFTLNSFSGRYKKALGVLGTKSGRDGNKIQEAGLTVISSKSVDAPCFKEAELIFECKKIYWQDMEASHFLSKDIHANYPGKDYHRIYFGEIISVRKEE